ncbi:MAG: H(+)-transporting ATPase [Bacilli bacterium]|nr:H(+)-transporting ATPase [Bacilli bacterium]
MLKKLKTFLKKQNSFRYIAIGFLLVILLGSGLLMIPGVYREEVGLSYINALYTSTSAVCVTGLIAVDTFDTFTLAGQIIIMFLIQIGGLGITTLGAGLIGALKRRLSLKEQSLIQESLNFDSARGLLALFKRVFLYTFIIEMIGAGLSMITFFKAPDYTGPGQAIFRSFFHSIAAFNNSGFDVIGGLTNFTIAPYNTDVFFNLLTCALIILGGLGFLVISDIRRNFFHPKKTSLHTKVVLLMTSILIITGMLLIALTERDAIAKGNFSWLGAFFASVTARTAGFSTYPIGKFTQAGLIVLMVLMFIGASPGSTGGGIKTTTFFVLFMGIKSMITHKKPHAFKYSVSEESIKKAMSVLVLGLVVVILSSLTVCIIESRRLPTGAEYNAMSAVFEMVSAYGTVGLSVGATPYLSVGSKVISIIVMYIGRVGPLTIMSSWYSGKDEYFGYAEGIIPIG